MRKIIAITLLASTFATGADLTLVNNGKSDYKIFIADKGSPTMKRGAGELQNYIEQMSGVKLEIVDSISKKCLMVGVFPATNTHQFGSQNEDDFILKTQGESLCIAGGKRGVMYG